jgi:DNA adenine methylase
VAYPGGKAGAGIYQRIINQIPPHDVYVESFLGDGAVLQRKRPAARNIAIEIDPDQAKAFAAGLSGQDRDAGFSGDDVELYNCCGIEWLKHAFGLYRIQTPNPAAPADRSAREATHDCPAAASSAGEVLRWFVYCDPPYLLSARRSPRRLYRFTMTEAQHADLLDVICRLPCQVAISGYWSPLYAAALHEWRCITFTAVTRGNGLATEHLWMNYQPPAELHDYRYLGDEKRERERITRKVRTWSAGLQRLPAHERQAILAALGGPRR